MHKRWLCQIDVGLELEARGPLLVKSGAATIVGADMGPVLTFRDGKEQPFIPGSSLKGVLRSHVERVARSLRTGSVCIPYVDTERRLQEEQRRLPRAAQTHLFRGCGHQLHGERGQGERLRERLGSAQWYRHACAACRLFGSTKVAGRLQVLDAYIPKARAQLGDGFTFETRDGVAIDRFTGGAAQGLKFDMDVVAAGSVFETSIRLESFELWQVAILHLLLDDLADGLLRVGSGRSRGLGAVDGRVTSFRVAYPSPQERLVGAAELLAQIGASDEAAEYGLLPRDQAVESGLPKLPDPGRRGIRHVYDLGTEGWRSHTEPVVPLFGAFLERGHGSGGWSQDIAAAVREAAGRR